MRARRNALFVVSGVLLLLTGISRAILTFTYGIPADAAVTAHHSQAFIAGEHTGVWAGFAIRIICGIGLLVVCWRNYRATRTPQQKTAQAR